MKRKNYITTNLIDILFLTVLIACITTFLGSILLLLGLLRNISGFILPWLIINISFFIAGLAIFITKLASPNYHISFIKITAVICYHILLAYFIISVHSFHTMIKRQRMLARDILHSNSNSSLNSGMYFDDYFNTQ